MFFMARKHYFIREPNRLKKKKVAKASGVPKERVFM
jgi:hypothetical protein